jgi:hypothetical protein
MALAHLSAARYALLRFSGAFGSGPDALKNGRAAIRICFDMKRALPPLLAILLVLPLIESRSIESLPVEAGSSIPMEWGSLADSCEHALEGSVETVRSRRTPQGGIETEIRMRVLRRHQGRGGVSETFRIPGGILPDGSGLLIPGMPRFTEGEELLLFLSAESQRGLRVPVGLDQGAWRIVRDAQGRKRLERPSAPLAGVDYEPALLALTRALEARRMREARR